MNHTGSSPVGDATRLAIVRRLCRLLPSSSFGVHEYAFVAVRSEADESTALSQTWLYFELGDIAASSRLRSFVQRCSLLAMAELLVNCVYVLGGRHFATVELG